MRTNDKEETNRPNGMGHDDSALALLAAKDERAREELIIRQEKNILRIASRAKHRFVTKSDDEWSIALCAFSRAIDTYRPGRGAFLPYAETLIRRSLIDAYRAEAKRAQELSVPPEAFEGGAEDDAQSAVLAAVTQKSIRLSDRSLRDEILAANVELKRYGFSFFDLTDCSPGRESARCSCMAAAEAVLAREETLRQLRRTRQLPIKRLTEEDGLPKKLMERYRKYIIATVVIRSGDYPVLKNYIRGVRGNEE
ncbi:MAG: RNA polymerase subunit sigma [Clostridiales bacterium]|nr:RNA polymerase subunit sigma [Clostridiales bacterium]